MKQYLLTIIAVLIAIILALFSIEPANNPYSTRSYRTYGYTTAPNNWSSIGDGTLPVLQEDNTGGVVAPLTEANATVGSLSALPEADAPLNTPPAMLAMSAMTELTPMQLPPLDAGMVNVTGRFDGNGQTAGYRVNPRPGEFAIAVPYDPSLLPQGFTEDDIQTYVYDRQYQRWMAIQRDSVNEAELLVCSRFRPWEKGLPHTQNDLANPQDALAQVQDMMSFASQGEGGGDSPLDFINAVLKTPEMPETSAYTPTSIKELKAADPLEGMTLIQPPTANNNGTANLSYPIEIPAGRQGMQPNLVLTYSSSGGNGWLGVGWDISIPSITVETRWGVPRYRDFWESEVYVYEGEQLVTKDSVTGEFRKMAHRTNDTMSIKRMKGNVQHFPRKNEAFDSIVRHGSGPSNYWWTVTHKNGVTDYYGKKHGSAEVNYNSVLCSPNKHNIAQWMLTESVDPSGNWVRYYYSPESRKSVTGINTNYGSQVYLDSIVYTGHDSLSGKYSVKFNRQSTPRHDIITNGRYGFREVTAVKLCNVEVLYKDTILRRYYFVTENSRESNFKTRLTDIVKADFPNAALEADCEDILDSSWWSTSPYNPERPTGQSFRHSLTRYNFEYYNYPESDSLFSAPVIIQNLANEGITSAFSNDNENATALGATRGSGENGGGTVTVGVADNNLFITDFNVGGNFSYGHSYTEGLITLIDLDGDGLSDKVFKQGGVVFYRPQVIDTADSLKFHFGDAIPIPGIHDFLFEESHQPSFGVQGSIMAVVAASAGLPTTISTTSVYFTDINGDGLPDLVTDKGALFNSLDMDGHPVFTSVNSYRTDPDNRDVNTDQMIVTSSTWPCGGIIFDGEVDPDIDCDYYYERDSVFYYGNPDTSSIISLLLTDTTIIPIGFIDQLFFFYHISNKTVHCGPIMTDPDIDAVKVWVAPFGGNITLTSSIRMIPDTSVSYRQSRYSDGVRYSVEKHNVCYVDSNMQLHDQTVSLPLEDSLNVIDTLPSDSIFHLQVSQNDILFFRIQSRKDRSFDNVAWDVVIEYDNVFGIDDYGKNIATYSSSEDYILTGQPVFQAPKKGTVTLKGRLTGNPGNNAGKLYITHGSDIDSMNIVANMYNNFSIDHEYHLNDSEIVMLEIRGNENNNICWGNIECRPHLSFEEDHENQPLTITETVSCYLPVRLDIQHVNQSDTLTAFRKFFGPLYRGWGQFAYKNDSISVNQPIELASMHLPAYLSDPNYTLDSTTIASALDYQQFNLDEANGQTNITVESLSDAVDNIFNPLSDNTRWVEMNPDMEHYCWAGFGNTTSIYREMMSNTRPKREIAVLNGDSYPTDMTVTQEIPEYDHPVPVGTNNYPVQTIRKRNVSVMGNGSLSVIGSNPSQNSNSPALSIGGSVAGGANYVLSDYLDLNGDRYPDVLNKKSVQYTMPWGGIGGVQRLNTEHDELCNSNTLSGGSTFSGSYPIPKRETGGNAQKAKITIDGLGGSQVQSTDETTVMYLDINGDGLPDRVYSDGNVALNVGYGFETKESWNTGTPRSGSSMSISVNSGLNFSFEQVSIGGGSGKNKSENMTQSMLTDFNGDGLPDKVTRSDNGLSVHYNFGNGQWSQGETVSDIPQISRSHSFSENGNGALTLGFQIGFFVKIQVGVQLSPYNSTFSRDNAQLTDINGDGYPDYVTSNNEDSIIVLYNRAGKTNLLRKVTNFTGSTIEMDYNMPLSCYEKPQRSWELASVEVDDPSSPLPAARSLTRFSYANPHYNRHERMEFGYGTVITHQYDTEGGDSLYRYTVEEFENHIFTKRGRKTRDCLYNAAGKPYIEHLYDATVYDFADNIVSDDSCARVDVYVGVESDLTNYYESQPTAKVTSRVVRSYDRYHNVKEYIHYGDTNHNREYFRAKIDYAKGMPYNMLSLPVRIEVKDADSTVVQLRTASYTEAGKLRQLVSYSAPNDSSVYNFSQDCFGNIDTCRLPANANGQRLMFAYHYDNNVHTYPVHVENVSLHFFSTAEYDYKIGKPVRTVDINGNEMCYYYDKVGRCTTILAPYEKDAGLLYTVFMIYYPKNHVRRNIFTPDTMQSFAITFHYDRQHPGNPILTTVISDGLGRMLQTKKDGVINGQEVSLVTGKVVYDCFGRTVAQYHPFTEDTLLRTLYDDYCDTSYETTVQYDILDRQTYVRTPFNLITTITYDFDTCMGKKCHRTTVTDAKGHKIKTLIGTLGQQLMQIAPSNTVTRFRYDALGRLLQSTDPDNISTSYTYDMLGRLIRRVHPDAGIDRYHYDAAGNLTSHVNALSDSVLYRYHYNQLTDVVFPRYPANNVHYLYGTSSNSTINAVGKVTFQEDASGWQAFKYGKLGEVTENIRTFALPFENRTYTFKMQYRYDSWNRIDSMIYPDGEVVTYDYNLGGMLKSVTGNKENLSYPYIDSIRYNEFEQKSDVYYGNGTRAHYAYDSLQRLKTLVSYTATNEIMQQLRYDYDSVGNITNIDNSAGVLTNGLGGRYHNNYRYDSLYRLVYSRGNWNGSPNTSYELEMTYLPNGRVSRKTLTAGIVKQAPAINSFDTVSYDNRYHYTNTSQPNTLTSIDNGPQQFFDWDAAGNMTYHKNTAIPLRRFFCWDEQNRLQGVLDDRALSVYQYDANGDRTYKLTGDYIRQNVSGTWRYFYQLNKATLYASPYLVVTPQGYTKHYYAENERIASKLGNGGLNDLDHPILEVNQVYSKLRNNTEHAQKVMYQCLHTQEARTSSPLTYLYNQTSALNTIENECYWYHPDHLGSSSWITAASGEAVQHLHYLPWGEEMVNQRHTVSSAIYTFSAKERDLETGLFYFGARYYSSDLSIWLSVDPMSDKYPSLSPYVYCADNPVKLVDPNGEAFDTELDETNQTITIHAVYYTTKKDAGALRKELDAWKKKGESYCYISEGKEYSVHFNLEIRDFDDVDKAIDEFGKNKDDGMSNYFQINKTVENHKHESANGINYEGNNMYVAKGQIRSIRHEIGHSLGLGDWNYGLMKSGGNVYGISKNNIISIFENAGIMSKIHNSLGDWGNRQTEPICTSKTTHNKSGLFKRKHNQ